MFVHKINKSAVYFCNHLNTSAASGTSLSSSLQPELVCVWGGGVGVGVCVVQSGLKSELRMMQWAVFM